MTLVPRQAPRTRESLRAHITFVVTYACVRGHVACEGINGLTTSSTNLTPTGVAAVMCSFVTTKGVFSRKAPTTE